MKAFQPFNESSRKGFWRPKSLQVILGPGSSIICGSSGVVWHNLGKLSLDVTANNSSRNVHEWARRTRQSRYTTSDQSKLNSLIGRAYDKLASAYDTFIMNGIEPSTAAVDAAQEMIEFCRTSPDTPLTAQLLDRAEDSAQAYTGCELAFKDRCTMCKAVFLFKIASAEKPDIEPSFAEKRPSGLDRGHCSEAIGHCRAFAHQGLTQWPR